MRQTTAMTPPLECTAISATEFEQLRAGARVLERDKRGDKVLLTPDDYIIKLFYPRRRFTSARLYPYAYRFCKNARRLQAKGIITAQCEQLRFDRQQGRHLIRYPLLPGDTLRNHLASHPDGEGLIAGLADFLAELHHKGILFRSIHLGNVLVLEEGTFGLIDIADMSIQRRPLGLLKRARNFRHLLHDRRDREYLGQYGYGRLLENYETAAGFSGYRSTLLRRLIRHAAPAMRLKSKNNSSLRGTK
ncbi:MAG: toluene tolerance protein [Pseudomonadota bacterium]